MIRWLPAQGAHPNRQGFVGAVPLLLTRNGSLSSKMPPSIYARDAGVKLSTYQDVVFRLFSGLGITRLAQIQPPRYASFMPKRSSKKRKDEDRDDPNVRAYEIIREVTSEHEDDESPQESPPKKNPHAVALGRRGGKKGGPARAKKLSAERRKEIARKAAEARWRSE